MTTFKSKVERQNSVMLLSTTGYRIEEIAKRLRVGHRTVDRDLVEIRSRVKKEVFTKTPEDVFTDIQLSRIARVRAIFSIFSEWKENPREKLHAADLLRKEDDFYLRLMERFGLVPKKSKRLTVNVMAKNVQVNKIEELNLHKRLFKEKAMSDEVSISRL
ncbi:hypothetical protein HYY73_02000 [Candidatus Woesearchaeota archaeon]|nr:hypothetical protein [Candidatus Woesearchaeota archaeon]